MAFWKNGLLELDEFDRMSLDITYKYKRHDLIQSLANYLRTLKGKHPDHIKQLGVKWVRNAE